MVLIFHVRWKGLDEGDISGDKQDIGEKGVRMVRKWFESFI